MTTDTDFVKALQDRSNQQTVWLPDDFEARWETLPIPDRWRAIAYWRRRNAEGTLGWRERRRIRQVVFNGQPLTECEGADDNLESINRQHRQEAEVRRRVRQYGKDGDAKIQGLANRLLSKRWHMPEERALEWAENVYRREQIR